MTLQERDLSALSKYNAAIPAGAHRNEPAHWQHLADARDHARRVRLGPRLVSDAHARRARPHRHGGECRDERRRVPLRPPRAARLDPLDLVALAADFGGHFLARPIGQLGERGPGKQGQKEDYAKRERTETQIGGHTSQVTANGGRTGIPPAGQGGFGLGIGPYSPWNWPLKPKIK